MATRKKTDDEPKPKPGKKAKAKEKVGKKPKPVKATKSASEATAEAQPVKEVPQETVEAPVSVDAPQKDAIPVEVAGAENVTPSPVEDSMEAMIDKMIVFHLADQRYSIGIDSVQEIQQIVAFSQVPSSGHGLVGMINLRGQVIPALDIRTLLGMTSQEYHLDTPMIICRSHGQLVALLVDEVEDVVGLPEGCLAAPPKMHGLADRMIGVCRMDNQLVYLLDVDRLLASINLVGGGY